MSTSPKKPLFLGSLLFPPPPPKRPRREERQLEYTDEQIWSILQNLVSGREGIFYVLEPKVFDANMFVVLRRHLEDESRRDTADFTTIFPLLRGETWVLLWMEKRGSVVTVEYFSPLGSSLPDDVRKEIELICNGTIEGLTAINICSFERRCQSDFDKNCGVWVSVYVRFKLDGKVFPSPEMLDIEYYRALKGREDLLSSNSCDGKRMLLQLYAPEGVDILPPQKNSDYGEFFNVLSKCLRAKKADSSGSLIGADIYIPLHLDENDWSLVRVRIGERNAVTVEYFTSSVMKRAPGELKEIIENVFQIISLDEKINFSGMEDFKIKPGEPQLRSYGEMLFSGLWMVELFRSLHTDREPELLNFDSIRLEYQAALSTVLSETEDLVEAAGPAFGSAAGPTVGF